MIGTHCLPCLFAALTLAQPAMAQSFPTKPYASWCLSARAAWLI